MFWDAHTHDVKCKAALPVPVLTHLAPWALHTPPARSPTRLPGPHPASPPPEGLCLRILLSEATALYPSGYETDVCLLACGGFPGLGPRPSPGCS